MTVPLRGFSQRLKFFRAEAGLSSAEMARKLNVSTATVSAWENGDGKSGIRMANLHRVADLLGINVRLLLDGPDAEEAG